MTCVPMFVDPELTSAIDFVDQKKIRWPRMSRVVGLDNSKLHRVDSKRKILVVTGEESDDVICGESGYKKVKITEQNFGVSILLDSSL